MNTCEGAASLRGKGLSMNTCEGTAALRGKGLSMNTFEGTPAAMAATAATGTSTAAWSTRRKFLFLIVISIFFLSFVNDYTLLMYIRRIAEDLSLGVSFLKSFYMLACWGLFSVVYFSYSGLCANFTL